MYSIDPVEIQLAQTSHEFDIRKYDSAVVAGDWDQDVVPFEESVAGTLLRSLRQLERGYKWEDTEYWLFLERCVKEGKYHCGVQSIEQLEARCYGFLDHLVARSLEANCIPEEYSPDPIGVCLTRDGQIVFNNGRHRVCVAKYLELPAIQVAVNVRHPEWMKFKARIRENRKKAYDQTYAPLRHFDLQDIKSCHAGRIEIIDKYISTEGRDTVLDLGAAWGSHSIYLAKKGMRCTAVENNHEAVSFLRKLVKASGQENQIEVYFGSVFELPHYQYDVVLALRLFHHFLKTPGEFEDLRVLLRRLDAKELYFQPHNKEVQRMEGAYRNFEVDEFLRFIMQNSKFSSCGKIGETEGGSIFKFT
jgi:hypothetical protein